MTTLSMKVQLKNQGRWFSSPDELKKPEDLRPRHHGVAMGWVGVRVAGSGNGIRQGGGAWWAVRQAYALMLLDSLTQCDARLI